MATVSASHSWIIRPKANAKARMRLFCFPYAGGGAAVYRSWSDYLPSEIEVCCLQLPGRENRLRDTPFTRISALVAKLQQVLLPYLSMPFALFGHSLGAWVGFEVARDLRKKLGLNPVCLFVSGSRAPHAPNPDPHIRQWPTSRFVSELSSRYQGLPEAVRQNDELMELMLPVLRADVELYETYVYLDDQPLDCPIAAFGGLQDGRVNREHLAAWQDQTRRSFTLKMFPGNHFFLESAGAMVVGSVSEELMRLSNQK